MTNTQSMTLANALGRLRDQFKTRDFMFHDGRNLRRFTIAGRTQAAAAVVGGVTLCFSVYGVAQAAISAVALTGVTVAPATPEARVAQLQTKVAAMQARVEAIKHAAAVQAERVERRQAMIAAVLEGRPNDRALAQLPAVDRETAELAADVIAPLRRAEASQARLAAKVKQVAELRYSRTAEQLRRLGIAPERFAKGRIAVGGPYEPVTTGQSADAADADAQFRSLFLTWKKLDSLEQGVIAIPSTQPVANVNFSSFYGVRMDPFRGSLAMHPGVDIPGAIGTPIYATADGVVARAERAGGYGNMVEIDHGRGIATRYGHMSKLLVTANTRVKRGQLIGLMGSTGRSTGSHLHYEVRIDGKSVNPIPFLQTADYLVAVQDRALKARGGMGGPASQ
jgi:murein DD-endopeptidase MepM/ murein hydrolase activator NlpD